MTTTDPGHPGNWISSDAVIRGTRPERPGLTWGSRTSWSPKAEEDPFRFRPQGPGGNRWREVAVEVTRAGAKVVWEGQRVTEMLAAETAKSLAELIENIRRRSPENAAAAGLDPAFAPGGGIGFCVQEGSASFRRVEVLPLKAEE